MSLTIERPDTFKIANDIEVNRYGYGGMQLTGKGVWGDTPDRENGKEVFREAVQAGVNFIDTADSYGPHTNEVLLAEALHPYPKGLLIATKGGLERTGPNQWPVNGDPKHIREAIDGSLKRLKLDVIDLWQLHRIDPKFPVAESLGPVSDAVQAGKIRYVGLSEVNIEQIEEAEKTVPIVSVQNLYNLAHREWESVLDYTEKRGMAFIPWFPLASGPQKMQKKIERIAEKYDNATTAQIALAWLFRRAPNILLIPGTSSVKHLHENLGARDIKLSDEDFEALSAAV